VVSFFARRKKKGALPLLTWPQESRHGRLQRRDEREEKGVLLEIRRCYLTHSVKKGKRYQTNNGEGGEKNEPGFT